MSRPRHGSPLWSEFPPHALRDYALLADGYRGVLLGPRGDMVWLCAPVWHSPAALSTLVGGDGVYAVTPTEGFTWGGYYEPGTLIWRSRWVTSSTTLECREALSYPADPHRTVILRRVLAIEHDVTVEVVLDVRAAFGARSLRNVHRREDGRWSARTGDLRVRWSGAGDAHVDDEGRLRAQVSVPAGGHHDLVLEISDVTLPDPVDPDRAWDATTQAWRVAVPSLSSSYASRDARHAYAVLRGLTSPGGGMVAAATLGLPERAEAGRNYDYRYVWLRDQAYAGLAAAVTEPLPLLDDAVSFTTARLLEHGDQVAPAYRIDGTPLPGETELDLSGYPGGDTVVGNWVNGQLQLDALGELLQLYAAAGRHDRLDSDAAAAARLAIDVVDRRWQEPDAGVWELDDDWWTHSRLSCVAGLRTLARVLPTADGAHAAGLADAIEAETARRCVGSDGAWQRSADRGEPDAALLLPPVRGALPANDPRTVATLEAVRNQLTEDGYVYRFAPDARPLGQAEGAFLLCGFMMSLAYLHRGDREQAIRWFERNRSGCGPSGLLTEEFDVSQRQLRGNIPQAFAHAMLLECAQRLALDEPFDLA